MEDVRSKICYLNNELVKLKADKDFIEKKMLSVDTETFQLRSQIFALDQEIKSKQNELTNRLYVYRQTGDINNFSCYAQDVVKRWMVNMDEILNEYTCYLDDIAPVGSKFAEIGKQMNELCPKLSENHGKIGSDQDMIKKMVEELKKRVMKDSSNDLRFEFEDIANLKKTIEVNSELLRYAVHERNLELPSFNYTLPPMDPIGSKKAIALDLGVGKRTDKISHKIPNEQRKQTSKRPDQGNIDAGSINQGKKTAPHRHHPYHPYQPNHQSRQQHQQVQQYHQHSVQHQQQKQQQQQKSEGIDISCNLDQFGSNGNSVQELPADQNTCDLTESSPKQSQEPDSLQVNTNHSNPARVKFEEDQNNSYSPKHSFNEHFDSLDIGQRKRKQEQNQSKISVNEAIDEDVIERKKYDDEEKEAKRAKLDADNEPRFDYFESDFPASFGINVQTNASQIEPMFSFTQARSFHESSIRSS